MDVSVIIPARNEQFLNKTIEDVLAKMRGDTQVIAVLDGYWPDPIVRDERVHYIHFSKPKGMRNCLNAGVAIAKGKFVMKLDAHCMLSEGFDVTLAGVCRDNWVCIPTRHRLDAENWVISDGTRQPINYQFLDLSNDELNGKNWDQKNRRRDLDAIRIDDLIACQGSCYFMPRDWWLELGLLDVEHYGTFRKDPQEVTFKTWTYGGRCVRVKDAWYAHLHKGRRYGRGYSGGQADWAKGDEFVKQWWTDSAWDRQKIPLREIIAQHFADMPGWDKHEWTQGENVTHTERLTRQYQVLTAGDRYFTRPRPEREHSRFWNEGKWATFIRPLLPGDAAGQTFVEMGCDTGLFLKLATDHGFGRVIGVEKNKTPVAVGTRYRDAIGYDYTILKRKLGSQFHDAGTFDIDELPLADVTLMSNFHYHVDLNNWVKYLDRLRSKSCYVLVVSVAEMQRWRWKPGTSRNQLKTYFREWEEVGWVDKVPVEDDPEPRNLYSVLYKSPLIERVPIGAITRESNGGAESVRALIELAIAGQDIDITQTLYYADWRKRKGRWSERTLRVFTEGKLDMIRSMVADGPKDPILVQNSAKMRLCDGGHRLHVLEMLGHKSAIVRRV